jgi:uncharacterized RDD family membrane protein YckC
MPVGGLPRTGSYPEDVSEATVSGGDSAQKWPGEHLGLPERGPGSVAGRGTRFVALLIDLVLAGLVTSLFVEVDVQRPEVMQQYNYIAVVVWFVITVAMVGLFGFTPGKALLGVRVVRLDGKAMVSPLRAIPRTLLTALLLPPVIADADDRGLHDRVTGTVVVRTR